MTSEAVSNVIVIATVVAIAAALIYSLVPRAAKKEKNTGPKVYYGPPPSIKFDVTMTPSAPIDSREEPIAATPPPAHQYRETGTLLADNISARILIRYEDVSGALSERIVAVARVRGPYVAGAHRPETFGGFCELRQDERFFMMRRVKAAHEADTGEQINDLERYLVGRGETRVRKIAFTMPEPEEQARREAIEAWVTLHGRHGTRHLFPAPTVTLEAEDGPDKTATFEVSIETVEQFGGIPFAVVGMGRQIGKGGRAQPLGFTLKGFHTPQREIVSLTPSGASEPTPDLVEWLRQQGRRRKRNPGVKPLVTEIEGGTEGE
jgi:hypothetical protein